MLKKIKFKENKEKYAKILFILFIFIFACTLAIIQPNSVGPDETMKMDICKYITEHGSLPHGGDAAVRHPLWGISYGFTPILSYIFGAFFIKIASLFTQDVHVFYIAARMVSVICYTIMGIFNIKIGEKLFKNKYYKWFFIVLTTLLPQLIFLASYVNNDSLALLSISIIVYSWICGLKDKWNIKNCVMLAVGIGICALSYYNAYGYILTSAIIFIASYFVNKEKDKKVDYKDLLKKGLLIALISFLICGWWFIRSIIIYNGDFLGMRTTNEYAEKYAIEELKPSHRETPQRMQMGLINMLTKRGWVKETTKSFIGFFGGMNVPMGMKFYSLYLGIFAVGIVGYLSKFYKFKHIKEIKKDKNKGLLEIIFAINIVIPIGLSIYYSYCSDYQPQGRYIMPMLIPFMYFIVNGLEKVLDKLIKNEKVRKIIQTIIIIVGILLPFVCLIRVIKEYY